MNQLVQELIKDLLEQKNQDYTIYLDIDDTLTNYSERLKSMIIDDPETGEKRPIKASDTVDNLEFWSSAKWLPGAEEMVDFIKNNFDKVEILSAVPELSKAKQSETGERFYNAPILGKEDWLKDNIGNIKTNWTRSGSQKAAFARPNTILIDDKPENIRAFQKAGGIGILYDNPSNVIAQLKYLLDNPVQEAIVGDEVVCDNCGWHWPIADGGDDTYVCHKCGYDNNPSKENHENGWNLKKGVVSLTKYMMDNGMNIKPFPKIKVINDDVENAEKLLGYTAYYNPGEQSITLYTLGRHPKDVLRSYAHEMVHHMQNLEGRLGNITTTNTNEDGNLPDIEKEAYETGNMMFRNWEDKVKNNV